MNLEKTVEEDKKIRGILKKFFKNKNDFKEKYPEDFGILKKLGYVIEMYNYNRMPDYSLSIKGYNLIYNLSKKSNCNRPILIR
ncbi:MAG TPA: hypothetical protein VJB35_00625 [Candidatus Nanoarchaeia archaeon]|nr:hypothetical protein [Candidatus Nanoarchaeia archaeon]